jgi:hypothetical protein
MHKRRPFLKNFLPTNFLSLSYFSEGRGMAGELKIFILDAMVLAWPFPSLRLKTDHVLVVLLMLSGTPTILGVITTLRLWFLTWQIKCTSHAWSKREQCRIRASRALASAVESSLPSKNHSTGRISADPSLAKTYTGSPVLRAVGIVSLIRKAEISQLQS